MHFFSHTHLDSKPHWGVCPTTVHTDRYASEDVACKHVPSRAGDSSLVKCLVGDLGLVPFIDMVSHNCP